jgi:hypothetical protein
MTVHKIRDLNKIYYYQKILYKTFLSGYDTSGSMAIAGLMKFKSFNLSPPIMLIEN